MEFGISSAFVDPFTNKTHSSGSVWGITKIDRKKDGSKVRTYLSHEGLLPLLRPDLNDAERMSIEWFLANTLVHEMMVSLGSLKSAGKYRNSLSMQFGMQ
jgi:hypothetical protein